MTLKQTIETIVAKHLHAAVEESIGAYRAILTQNLGDAPKKESKTAAPTAPAKPSSTKGTKRPGVGAKVSAALKNRACPFPGCTNASKGPRYRFFCETHRVLPVAEQQAHLDAQKARAASPVAAPAPAAKKARTKVAKKPAPNPERKATKQRGKKKANGAAVPPLPTEAPAPA